MKKNISKHKLNDMKKLIGMSFVVLFAFADVSTVGAQNYNTKVKTKHGVQRTKVYPYSSQRTIGVYRSTHYYGYRPYYGSRKVKYYDDYYRGGYRKGKYDDKYYRPYEYHYSY
jgi:hypothetical protein